jgi:uncharacterized membrane protein YdjX (TVP38/TMEM64 family)
VEAKIFGSRRTRVLTIALLLITLAVVGFLLWSRWDREALLAWKREAGPFRYFAAMALLPAVGVPITPFFMVAGALFGARLGLLGSALALAANLTLCHRLAAGALRPRFAKVLERFDAFPDFAAQSRGALRFTLLVKFAPGLPAAAKNYLLGLAGVPFATYFAVSMTLTGGLGVALVLLGESLFEHDLRLLTALLVTLALIAAVLLWLRKRSAAAAGDSRE